MTRMNLQAESLKLSGATMTAALPNMGRMNMTDQSWLGYWRANETRGGGRLYSTWYWRISLLNPSVAGTQCRNKAEARPCRYEGSSHIEIHTDYTTVIALNAHHHNITNKLQ